MKEAKDIKKGKRDKLRVKIRPRCTDEIYTKALLKGCFNTVHVPVIRTYPV